MDKSIDQDAILKNLIQELAVSQDLEAEIYGLIKEYCNNGILGILFSDIRGLSYVKCGDLPDSEDLLHMVMSLSVIVSTARKMSENLNDKVSLIRIEMAKKQLFGNLIDDDYFLVIETEPDIPHSKVLELFNKVSSHINKLLREV